MREVEPADVDDADQHAVAPAVGPGVADRLVDCGGGAPCRRRIQLQRLGGMDERDGRVVGNGLEERDGNGGGNQVAPAQHRPAEGLALCRRGRTSDRRVERGNRARVIVRRHAGAFRHELDHHIHKRIVWGRLRLERLTFRQPGRAGTPAAKLFEVLRRSGGERRRGQDPAGGLGGCGGRGDRGRHVGAKRIDRAVAVGDDAKARVETTGRSIAVGHGFSCHIRRTSGPLFRGDTLGG